VYEWLERAVSLAPTEDVLEDLRNRRWVLAQRADTLEFRRSTEVVIHPGAQVLGARFWVPSLSLPDVARRAQAELGFLDKLAATPETLRDLGECLAQRGAADDQEAMHVYALIAQMLDETDSLRDEWRGIANELPVYRTFGHEEAQRTAFQVFIGDADHGEDLSDHLVCLKARSLPRGLVNLYRQLGVADRPTVAQVAAALAKIDSAHRNARAAHGRLVRALEDLTEPNTSIDDAWLGAMRVLSCSGTYEPVSRCQWDEEFGRRGRVSGPQAAGLIDLTDRSTQRLVSWLRERDRGVPAPFRAAGGLELCEQPPRLDLTPELAYALLPWRQWVQEAVREGSALRDGLGELGLNVPRETLEIVPVERIRARLRLEDGRVIEQAADWDGPLALSDGPGRVLVRASARRGTDVREIAEMDAAIAREVAMCLGGTSVIARLKACVDRIVKTVERPTTVLRRLRETYEEHFRHQYHDQVADPHFAELFDEYQRTARSSARAAELRGQMDARLVDGFVAARREQIRGYGYDEVSVFAELLQNAEDAYIQRARLGMEMPEPCDIRYQYLQTADTSWILSIEHRGRPFNYWQHGVIHVRDFSRDVEGVLRSAGSFKPHAEGRDAYQPDLPTIGRFGLGFKSVYLLTDRPEIHSGAWHFAIEAGCLPQELPPPDDIQADVTRFRLPLRADVDVLRDASQLLDLLPFLRMITRLELRVGDDVTAQLNLVSRVVLEEESTLVEQVTVSGQEGAGDEVVQLLRCRSRQHAGQLAILLATDGTPARWDERFRHDLFAALPLRAKLGCGVATSHRFEVQSGRTHLVDPKANAHRFAEVAALLESLVEGLRASASASVPRSSSLTRFWSLWRWERGDAECDDLRKALARALVGLAERAEIVPTLAPEAPTSLAEGPRFFFVEISDAFRDALVAAGVTIPMTTCLVAPPLTRSNVVAEGFAGAYRRACEYAGVRRARTLVSVGWSEVAAAFRERAWFAEVPELLSCLADTLNEDQARTVSRWLSLCCVLGQDGDGQAIRALPGDLVEPDFPGMNHLPRRLLRRVSTHYNPAGIALLRGAGLRDCPSSGGIRAWVDEADLSAGECVGILRYLAQDSRFMEYRDLASLLRSPWFPRDGHRLSTADAVAEGLIPDDVLMESVFRAWLGLDGGVGPPPGEPPAPQRDPRAVLEGLFAWWEEHGAGWRVRYEERLYPAQRPPALRNDFDERNLEERRRWVTLFLLGALQSMGRTRLEQHREFLRRCDRKGWLDVFAEREQDARRWMEVLEQYLEDPSDTHDYYQWMKQFVVIFQISRWLPEYVEGFLNVDRITRPFGLDEIVAPRTSALFSGGGPDAPALTRALGIGTCFVLRELMRLRVLRKPWAYRYCYVPALRVCSLLENLGCSAVGALPSAERSSEIHRFLVSHLGAERATFDQAFDLPLLALAEDPDLQDRLMGHELPREENGE
jgi:hypothetical protein